MTIVLIIFTKYAVSAISFNKAVMVWENSDENEDIMLPLLMIVLTWTLSPASHIVYASLYLKTCILIRGIVKKAVLLFERN